MSKFNQITQQPQAQASQKPSYSDRQFLHTFLAGAFLPLVQASITAVMVGIGTFILLYLIGSTMRLKPALIVASIVWIVTWLYLQRRWLTLTSLEQITGLDLNQDGQIGQPVKGHEQLIIRLDEITKDQHYRSRTIDSVISKEKLTIVARGLLDGIPFAERRWTGDGKPLSINEFRSLRSMWLKHGLLEVVSDKDHRQGFDFTAEGWAVLEKLSPPVPELKEEQDEINDLTDEELRAIEAEMIRNASQYKKGDS